jgi:hypothetical protein
MNFDTHLQELDPSDAQAFRAVAARLRAAPERQPSPGMEARILAAVEQERQRERRRFRAPSPWWGAAAAAGLLAAVTLFDLSGRLRACKAASPRDPELAWLAENQEADGTWSPAKHGGSESYRPALTALSALALERSGVFGPHVDKACRGLSALQDAQGAFGGEGRARLYNQALATYALAELCSAHPEARPALASALRFVADRQTLQGGWDYEAGSEGNAALTSWLVRALACAQAQGFREAGTPLRKGLRWLRSTARDDGSIAYHRGSTGRSDSLTALAAHALITAGQAYPELPALGRQVAAALSDTPDASAAPDCYRDYAKVLALDSSGAGDRADLVRQQMSARRQPLADQWGSVGGRLYTTALTALASK